MSSSTIVGFRDRFRKPGNASSSLERRRARALASQRDSRAKTVAKARAAALLQLLEDGGGSLGRGQADGVDRMQDEEQGSIGNKAKQVSFNMEATVTKHVKSRRELREERYADQFLIPEWMIDVPTDLDGSKAMNASTEEQGWFVMARPEGQRCLVIAAKGFTESRKKNGKVLHRRFASVLPGGSKATRGRMSESCVLECIFQEQSQTYFVIDLVCWKGQVFYECSAAFRGFWLESKLSELGTALVESSVNNEYRFQPVPRQECTYDGLKAAYLGKFNYVKDGLLFYNKSGHYTKGLTPLVLAWRDRSTSRFSVDTPDGVNPYPTQSCVLKLSQKHDKEVLIAHGEDIVSPVPLGSSQAWGAKQGDLIRFTVDKVSLLAGEMNNETEDHIISVEGLQFQEICGRNRLTPDSSCKIMFQYMSRTTPLKIDAIISMVQPT